MKTKKTGLSLKAIIQFIVLCIGASTIYLPVYCKNTYYDALLEAFNVNNTQFATMCSVYTLFTLITYFPGGVIADRVPPRKLLTVSFLGTAALTFAQLQFPSYTLALVVYGAMGVTTTFTFWSALIKATRQFGQLVGGESKALGSLEGGRNISKIAVSTFCLWLFAKGISQVGGLKSVLTTYAIILALCGIGAWFAFNDEEQAKEAVAQESLPKLIAECLKNKYVWVCCFSVLGAYAISTTLDGYVSAIASSCFSLTPVMAALVSTISLYVQPFGSFGGGWLGDKLGGAKIIMISDIGLVVFAFIITLLPASPSMAVPFVIIYLFFAFFRGMVRGQYYAPLREIGIPMHLSGTAVGLIATLGYSPDFFLPLITGRFLDTMESVAAYKVIIYILCGFGIFSAIMASIIVSHVNKNKQQMAENN